MPKGVYIRNERTKTRLRLMNKGRKVTWNKKLSEKQKELWKNKKYRENQINSMKIKWQNQKYREKITKAIIRGLYKRPTSYEKRIINLCEKYKLPFKYVGDGTLLVGWYNPDFISTNKKKLLIEVFYSWFKVRKFGSVNKYKERLKNNYSKFSFNTLFLDENDIEKSDKFLLNKIKKFLNG